MAKLTTREQLFPPLWVLASVLMLLALWLIVQLKEIVVLLVVGYCIAYVVNPILTWGERRKISRSVGFFVVATLFTFFLVTLFLTAVPTLTEQYQRLAANFPSYVQTTKEKLGPLFDKIRKVSPDGSRIEQLIESPLSLLEGVSGGTIKALAGTLFQGLLGGYSITLTVLNLLLLPFIAFYLAVDFKKMHHSALYFFPVTQRKHIAEIARELDGYISAFVRGQMSVGCILFVLYFLGLKVIGVELAMLLAVISGFGNMIPYLGFLLGIVLSSVLALVTFGTWSALLQVWALFGFVQFLEGMFITPKVVGEKVGLSPLAVILAIFAGGSLFGILGIFLAVPGAAAFKVLGRRLHRWMLKRADV